METNSTTSTTSTTRPECPEELPDYQTEGHRIADISDDMLTQFPEVAVHLLHAINTARGNGLLQVSRGDGRTRIVKPLSDIELANRLRQAQESWDRLRDAYVAATDPEVSTPEFLRPSIDRWAREEGMPGIAWAAMDAQAAS